MPIFHHIPSESIFIFLPMSVRDNMGSKTNIADSRIDLTEAWLQVDASTSGFRSEGGRSGLYGAEDSQQEEEVTDVTDVTGS